MGFSVAATAAIIGVSVLMIIEISLGSFIPMYTDIIDSYEDMKDRSIEELQTMVNVQNVTVIDNSSLYDLNITIENTGSITIDTNYASLLIEGEQTSYSSSKTYIYPESTSYLTIYGLSGTGEKKVKFITKNGISCYETYNATV